MRIVSSCLLAVSILLTAGCATDGGHSGLGMPASELAKLEPSKEIHAGPLTPLSLVGVAPEALSARLGRPSFRRSEPGAEVWQYAGSGCSLFVYFYKTDAGALASSYVDARKVEGGPADPSDCLSQVMSRRGAVPLS